MRPALLLPPFILWLLLISGCAHRARMALGLQNKIEPRALLAEACAPGEDVRQVNGNAVMHAKSQEVSGTFSAAIEATAPGQLKLEVLHPFGGTLALLTVNGSDYSIEVPGHPERARQGSGSWGGIPLVWATRLFLGRIPCPDPDELKRASVFINSEDELHVEIPRSDGNARQSYVYLFRIEHQKYWPETLHWSAGARDVDFSFDDPDGGTLSPKEWSAKSPRGNVKLRWRDREIRR